MFGATESRIVTTGILVVMALQCYPLVAFTIQPQCRGGLIMMKMMKQQKTAMSWMTKGSNDVATTRLASITAATRRVVGSSSSTTWMVCDRPNAITTTMIASTLMKEPDTKDIIDSVTSCTADTVTTNAIDIDNVVVSTNEAGLANNIMVRSMENVMTNNNNSGNSDNNNNNNNNQKKSWTDDGFVFGLNESGLQRPTGRNALLVVDGDSLQTQPYQVAMVTAALTSHAWIGLNAMSALLLIHQSNGLLTALHGSILIVMAWILADFGSGVLHWSVDNYGNGRTPIMGGIIAAFQGHHTAPWTITQRGFCNNVYKLCIPFGLIPVMMITMFQPGPITALFWTSFCVFEILSQEFHKWSHQLMSELPNWIRWLQQTGFTVGREPHAQHHLAPFDGNYCIISGICNKVLDHIGFFRWMEHIIYQWNGVEANAWKLDPTLRTRTLAGDYQLVIPSRIKN